jgi:hypothetical protein
MDIRRARTSRWKRLYDG